MAWDIATARLYLGEPTDPPSDAMIQSAMDYVLASIELRLGRELLEQQVTHTEQNPRRGEIIVSRYPVVSVDEVDGGAVPTDITVIPDQGILQYIEWVSGQPVTLLYTGGYDPLPPDLERVLWEAFAVAWAGTNPDTGGPTEGAVEDAVGAGVKSLTVFDAFRLDYQDTSASLSAGAGPSDQELWGWLSPWSATLSFYRSGPEGSGLGIA